MSCDAMQAGALTGRGITPDTLQNLCLDAICLGRKALCNKVIIHCRTMGCREVLNILEYVFCDFIFTTGARYIAYIYLGVVDTPRDV